MSKLKLGDMTVAPGMGVAGSVVTTVGRTLGRTKATVADTAFERSESVKESGVMYVTNSKEEDLAEKTKESIGGHGADRIADMIGSLLATTNSAVVSV